MPSLSCLHPLSLGIVVRFHLFSLCGAGVGHPGPLEHDILREDCFYHTTQDGSVYNPSASNQQGTRLLNVGEAILILVALNAQCCMVTPDSCLLELHFWFPGETTGFFRLILFSLCLSLHRFLVLSALDISGHAVVGLISKN